MSDYYFFGKPNEKKGLDFTWNVDFYIETVSEAVLLCLPSLKLYL